MIDTIYVEQAAADHPRAQEILARFSESRVVPCRHYGEVFNRHNQNFRLQKTRPALILARKLNRRLLPVPAGYGLDGATGHYFSHMLNCLYDCRYCFLQGMFRSAHYVLFVNYEDFAADIDTLCDSTAEPVWLFSGYDCDSLALEPVTGFAAHFVPLLERWPNAWLELRTKSTQIRALLDLPPHPRCVCAFSLSPQPVIDACEHRTPTLAARLEAMAKLMAEGWPVGLRLDPLVLVDRHESVYGPFLDQVFAKLDAHALHSVTLGAFRLPQTFARRIGRLYPDEPLFARPFEEDAGVVGHAGSATLSAWCRDRVECAVPAERVFVQRD